MPDGITAKQSPTDATEYSAAHAECIATDDPRLREK
jgi:hypothetical protein